VIGEQRIVDYVLVQSDEGEYGADVLMVKDLLGVYYAVRILAG
jgi:hypothetical protein